MALAPIRRVLPNGVTILAQSNRLIPAVSFAIGVDAGATMEPAHASGTAALVARVLDKGTTHRDRDTIADTIESRGASLSAGVGRQQLVASATCLVDDAPTVLPVLCDVVVSPTFPEAEVATRRAELTTAIREAEDDPGTVASDALMAALYPDGHPFGRPVRGTVASVEQLTREHLAAHHRDWCVPATATVVAVGDIDPAVMVDAIARELGDWRGPNTARVVPPAPSPVRARRLVSHAMPDKAQADIAYGFVGITRADPDYYAAVVMNNALGQYALGGRLGDSIRERQGMAYYVFSSLDAGFTPGPLMVRAGVAAENVERTIASIDDEIRAIVEQGFTAAEVEDAKLYLVGSLPRQLETNAGIAGFLLSAEVFDLGIDHDVRLPALVQAVSYDDVMRVARRMLDPARAVVSVAGPWHEPTA